MATGLKQRGRANFNFLADLAAWSGKELQAKAANDLDALLDGVELPGGEQQRIRTAAVLLEKSQNYTWDRFYTRFSGERQFLAAREAYDEGSDLVEAEYAANADKGGTLVLDPTVVPPKYWSETEFHLAPGGWEGHDRMGFMIHDYVYDLLFATGGIGAVKPGESFADQRYTAAQQGRAEHYDRILEMGIGTGRYAVAIQRAYPDAKISGVDLGRTELEHAKLIAARNGFEWDLRQAACEATPYADDTFDLTTAFILLHEVPVPAAKDILTESFRVTKPGGEILIADVAPYRYQDSLFRCVVLDWETENRDEPFWRGALLQDRAQLLRDAGFVDVEEFGVGPGNYPWVTRGVKPAEN